MSGKKIITGIDVGTTKIVSIIAEYDDDMISIVGLGESKSNGLERGVIVNIEKTIKSLQDAIFESEKQCKHKVESVFIGISGDHIRCGNGNGVLSVSDTNMSIGKVIEEDDKKRVLQSAKPVNLPLDRRILHVLSQHYKVDDRQENIVDPLGLTGNRLEANVHYVTSSKKTENDFITCFNELDIDINGFVLEPLASSYSILNNDEKELGTIMIDIGGGTTDVVIWKNGGIKHTYIVPKGGQILTRDIATVFKCSISAAERLKIKYGCAVEGLAKDENVIVKSRDGIDKEINLQVLSKVIQDRMVEILREVKFEIEKHISINQLSFGIVITGGGAKLCNISEIAENIFKTNIRIGSPSKIDSINNRIFNPRYSTSIGLIHYAADNKDRISNSIHKNSNIFQVFFRNIKDLFN
ncbi:MAG: cell division protein FtsA [Candidatus Marinimicrobia bacterium]|nr:cell division protein FtsA [Candidatus Neomarinimicrobiota bacterium]